MLTANKMFSIGRPTLTCLGLILTLTLVVDIQAAPTGLNGAGGVEEGGAGGSSDIGNSPASPQLAGDEESDPFAEALDEIFENAGPEQCAYCNLPIPNDQMPLRANCSLHCYHRRCHSNWHQEMAIAHNEQMSANNDRRCPVCMNQVRPTIESNIVFDLVENLSDEAAQEVCPICHDELGAESQPVVTTKCHHLFHSSCIKLWADRTPIISHSYAGAPERVQLVCPVCREKLQK